MCKGCARVHIRKVKRFVMWSKTYINTIKNIFRSASFWLLFLILIITAISGAINGYYVGDDEPGTILSHNDYIQVITNSLISTLAFTALPFFSIVTTVLVINRDYGDDFFEIEKAAGVNYLKYLTGRLAAIISIVAVVTVITHALCLQLYLYTRGGVPYLDKWGYVGDSIIRMLRADFCVMIPSLIFYVALTYFFGTIFKKGIHAALSTSIYLLSYYVSFTRFRFRFTGDIITNYFDYFSPLPWKLRMYFQDFDSEWHDYTIYMADTSLNDAIFCVLFLIVVSIAFSLISYLRTRKRTA